MGAQREDQAGRVGEDQDAGDGEGEVLEVAAVVDRASPALREASPLHEREEAGMIIAATASSSIVDWTLAAVLPELLHARGRPPPADQHRGAHHQQDVPEDRSDQRGLDDLVQALAEREEGDDQLGRVAEGDVEQAADDVARSAPRAPRWLDPSSPPAESAPRAETKKITVAGAPARSTITAAGISGESRYGQLSAPSSRRVPATGVGLRHAGSLGPATD